MAASRPMSTEAKSGLRHLWVTFGLFTATTGLLLWWVEKMPRGLDETGFGRGLVALIGLAFWVFGLLFTLGMSFYLWKGRAEGVGCLKFLVWALAIPYAVLVVSDVVVASGSGVQSMNERNASFSLKTISSAEYDFRKNDRDGNGERDFWVGDVTGLYLLQPPEKKEMIKLIELSIACADDRPATVPSLRPLDEVGNVSSKAGYWYRALTSYETESGETKKYDAGNHRNRERFGFCTWPDHPRVGRRTYIINEASTIYWKDTEGKPVDTFPRDPIAEGWEKLD